ncbi:hypothetical protein KSP39_PZI001715 [Platanthera zijinensis]|uniref:Uncharacterized protein n=1 Tax=Platanthera zijinensis TaxID=2320716 RepID=A0AAP0C0L1_9ASPA
MNLLSSACFSYLVRFSTGIPPLRSSSFFNLCHSERYTPCTLLPPQFSTELPPLRSSCVFVQLRALHSMCTTPTILEWPSEQLNHAVTLKNKKPRTFNGGPNLYMGDNYIEMGHNQSCLGRNLIHLGFIDRNGSQARPEWDAPDPIGPDCVYGVLARERRNFRKSRIPSSRSGLTCTSNNNLTRVQWRESLFRFRCPAQGQREHAHPKPRRAIVFRVRSRPFIYLHQQEVRRAPPTVIPDVSNRRAPDRRRHLPCRPFPASSILPAELQISGSSRSASRSPAPVVLDIRSQTVDSSQPSISTCISFIICRVRSADAIELTRNLSVTSASPKILGLLYGKAGSLPPG